MAGTYPEWFSTIRERHQGFMNALDQLGASIRREGPLDEKTAQLLQLAASVALRSEGAVHSHARRAMQAGATPQELTHTIILLTSTIGFPNVSAALRWVEDIIGEEE